MVLTKIGGGCLNFWKLKFYQILFVFVNMGPNGSENFKTLLLLQIAAESFQIFLNFLANGHNKTMFGIFEIWNFRFLTIFFRKLQIHHCTLQRNQKPQLSGKRAIVEQNVQLIYVQLLKLWPIAKFHAQIGQFWKLASISENATHRAKLSSISTPWGRKRIYVQLLELWPLAKFHAQIWQFWKTACISETAACRAKTSSILTP